MDELIKQISKRLKVYFITFWLLPVLIAIVGESGIFDCVGIYAGNVRLTYIVESLTIIVTAISVPVVLKYFARILSKKIDHVSSAEALHLYSFWSGIRMLVLAVLVIFGFTIYYLMLSTTGMLCAFIALTASLFCYPSEKRLRQELRIEKE
jgi:hypothetical protein